MDPPIGGAGERGETLAGVEVRKTRSGGGRGRSTAGQVSEERGGQLVGSACAFCRVVSHAPAVRGFGEVVAFLDTAPVAPLHWLVVPRRHAETYFDLSPREKQDTDAALVALRSQVVSDDATVSGFTIGWNCGRSAGQTVMHAHCHLIPRRDGDVEEPRGGVRGVIPSRQAH